MVLLFYVDYFLIFSTYKGIIDEVYLYLQVDFKKEDDGDINNYLGINLDRRPDVSINLRQTYLNQSILNIIPVVYK